MKPLLFSLLIASALPVLAEDAGLLIQLGLNDKESTVWDGSIKVTPGEVQDIAGWRFEKTDHIEGKTEWKASTRSQAVQGRTNRLKKVEAKKDDPKNEPAQGKGKGKGKGKGQNNAQQLMGPVEENGVFVRLHDVTSDSVIEVTTAQGTFNFKLGQVKDGEPLDLLDGRAAVQRTAVLGRRLSPERTDDDYPALTMAKDGTGYLVYQSFTPGIDRDERAKRWETEPADLSFLAKPVGGDQLWLHVRKDNKWDERIAVTETGRDIYKSAVSIDGKGVAWVVWSERAPGYGDQRDNFDIFVRPFEGGKLGVAANLSSSQGNDVNAVASTDKAGIVWVAWQGAKDGRFHIFAKHQTANGWSDTISVSSNKGNCWMPSIAAGGLGVAIAWDTYEKGDFDVWVREFATSGEGKPARTVANSGLYEARPSLTYDKDGALWIAWEKSGQTWGKDWGAYDGSDGLGLYRDRQIGLIVLKDGKWMEPADSIASALPGAIAKGKGKGKRRGADATAAAPPVSPEQADGYNPQAFLEPAKRKGSPGEHAQATGPMTFNNLGRLACDADGRIWCLVRTRLNSFRGPVGSTWATYATYYYGNEWVGPILVPHSDNLIYNLPALAAGPQALFVAHSSDHRMDRFAEYNKAKDPKGKGGNAALDASKDPFDNDVFFSRLQAQNEAKPSVLKAATTLPADNPQPSARTVAELAEVKACRDYRANIGGKELRIVRGEFHRHTEISGDGAGDGPLEDMWRYAIDAASMDWLGNGDHDNGNGREYTWWLTQKTTDAYHMPGTFTPMFSYERSVSYPEGHRNVVFAQRGVRTLPRLPISDPRVFEPAPDTLMLYKYLHLFKGVCASHTSVGTMGTDWRNWDGEVEPMVEVYQGARQNYEYPGCPRCPTENDAIGGWEPAGFINNAFAKGYKFSFQSSSDHGSTHISYAMVYTDDYSREGIVAAMRKRHTYGATDNIVADVRCKAADGTEKMMGDEFSVKGAPTFDIKLIGSAPFAKVTLIKDNVEIPLAASNTKDVHLTWTDPKPEADKTSYYYVRGEQANSELVWASPMWIKSE